ncbi:MAG: hypothetical protein AB8A49_08275 [Prochlorococcus sp.]|jgi:hypothetical protein|nr:hypothetical protein [Prochlorococcaceae cyanobacterium ETNP2_MAG_10]MDP6195865.1 hypothetical protein [Prochlorococcaceae cyanobacterium ETNP18_MAG_17]MDP6321208.1 hypothetical protein [Prochlorococcaceae cyanobacterium ETNP14_MAG_5]MDP6851600.1 hypothetical protein [Prochlorococcaceae cyanobacterium ETNP1_MAG_8]|tara:strand:+ start:317 stop:490 length:174 start_codon:yes stop_codon:yes gene_type:complete
MPEEQQNPASADMEENTSGDYLGGWGRYGNSFVLWVSVAVLAACVGVLLFSITLLNG